MSQYDDFDDDIFEDDDLYDEMLGEDDYENYTDEFDDEDFTAEVEDTEDGLDFLGMVQDEEGNWAYPEDLD